MSTKSIAVIGGGPAGFAAAIEAARAGARVTLFEANERVGNTIKLTGDGRCNIANTTTSPECYYHQAFVAEAFKTVTPEDALDFLATTGLLLREESQGRLYPWTNKSTSVIDALRLSAAHLGVREMCSSPLRQIKPPRGAQKAFQLCFADASTQSFDRVILACGAAHPLGFLPKELQVVPFEPRLAPMATSTEELKGLDKVRARCVLRVRDYCELGEVTFRTYGISGIVAFNATRFAVPGDVIELDFLPDFEPDISLAFLEERLAKLESATWLDFTCGMLLPLVARAVLRQAQLTPELAPRAADLPKFLQAVRGFRLMYRGIGDAKLAQVHRGGICLDQIDPARMAIRSIPGLYAAGEMLDVDGPCGGYNLHWAWCSGLIAGGAAARD